MGRYRTWKDGYAIEGTFGSTAIPIAGTSTYKWGAIGKKTATHPSPRTSLIRRATAVGEQEVPAGEVYKSVFKSAGQYSITLQNGVLLWAIMGKSANAGADPYTHTITTPTAVNGVLPLLPSFTIQHERTGTATAWRTQYLGCKVGSLVLSCGSEQRYLIAGVNWLCQRPTNPGFALTADPALPAIANEKPYNDGAMAATYEVTSGDGATSMDGLQHMELTIGTGLEAIHEQYWDSGVDKSRWPRRFSEASRKEYELVLQNSPGSSDLWDVAVAATGNVHEIIFTWTRGTNDYIKATLEDVEITYSEMITPETGTSLVEEIMCEPRSVTFEVKDRLNGTPHYEVS